MEGNEKEHYKLGEGGCEFFSTLTLSFHLQTDRREEEILLQTVEKTIPFRPSLGFGRSIQTSDFSRSRPLYLVGMESFYRQLSTKKILFF